MFSDNSWFSTAAGNNDSSACPIFALTSACANNKIDEDEYLFGEPHKTIDPHKMIYSTRIVFLDR